MPEPKKPVAKRRIDVLLVERGFAENQSKAQALVLAGIVTAGGRAVAKPGTVVRVDAVVAVAAPELFVGRGGVKLEHALDAFGIEVVGKIAVDVGSSTGGFVDCLLQRGAARVYAVDVGKGQLDWGLRQDGRVVVMEGTNARYPLGLPEVADMATVDVSFISVTRVIPSAADAVRPGGDIVVLVKPQFEAQRREVGRGGVVVDPETHARVLGRVVWWGVENGFRLKGLVVSPITGAAGNREFFVLLRRG